MLKYFAGMSGIGGFVLEARLESAGWQASHHLAHVDGSNWDSSRA